MKTPQLLTIGHSTHSIERFIELLRRHGVDAVADVRSTPASRFALQFNREALRDSLEAASIRYVFLGRELGARSSDPRCYVNGKVQYGRLARTPEFYTDDELLAQALNLQESEIAYVDPGLAVG